MKNPGADVAQLTPNANGWRLQHQGLVRELQTLDEAAAVLPARARLHLAIPCQMALMERLTLPSTNREELVGMAQLQLEKTLPYPIEEVASDLEVIHQNETDSTVLSLAVHTPPLADLCRPLRDRQRIPQKITVFAVHVASACPPDETVLAVWSEQGQLALAVCEQGKLSWAHTLPDNTAETLSAELPSLLLSAEMEGVPTNYTRILVSKDCERLKDVLREASEAPIGSLPVDQPLPEPEGNLVPGEWTSELRRLERMDRVRHRLMIAAVVYLVLVAAAFVFLAVLKQRARGLDRDVAALRPKVESTQAQQDRWEALAPALDRTRQPVEILHQVTKSRPNADVHITAFDFSLTGFSLEGESATYDDAIAYGEKLRATPELQAYKITDTATILKDNVRASFKVFGKL